MPTFADFAGQEIASGIRTNEPVIAFETTADRTVLNNIAAIKGLIPKISKVIIRETRVEDNPLDQYFRKSRLPYGVGFEDFQFAEGAVNKKNDGTCVPYGNPDGIAQLNLINLAWSFDVSIYDREIDKAVLGPDEVGQYVAQKMRTMRKGYVSLKKNAMLQLLSDVIDGTRSIASTDQSDGNGNSVTYAPNITGYAGQILDDSIVLPALTSGTVPAFASASDALTVAKTLQDAAAEMMTESSAWNKRGIETFCLERPLLIMETRTLNAIDNAWAMDGSDKKIPTRTFREFARTFSEVVEVPKFADLPTNSSYTDKRLGAVLIDRDSLSEAIVWEDTESQRCAKSRMTGFNLGGASTLAIYRGNPAAAYLFDTQ